MHKHNYHPRYRPDIDGLRALAILPVVAYHAFPHSFPGGFIGVDVFFVISGFLISSIIFQSLRNGDFSFPEFYAHRIKRIFPALVLVITSCYVFGWFALMPDEFKQLGKHIAASAGFVQNFALWNEAGYFDTASELKPLLHLWSLAVEEQYYLIFPLLVWGAWRARMNMLFFVAILALVSFGLNEYGIREDATETFFLPQTRFWELLAGSVLAYRYHFSSRDYPAWVMRFYSVLYIFRQMPPEEKQKADVDNILSACGISLILFSVFALDRSMPYPGGRALLPVVGALLIIRAGEAAWLNARLLAWRPVVFVGLISYPLYLWHWPLLSFARILYESRLAALILSFVLAWLTYRMIEQPVRLVRPTWRKTVVLCTLMVLVGYAGFNAYSRDGLPFRQAVKPLVAFNDENFGWHDFSDEYCNRQFPAIKYDTCRIAREKPPTIVLIGDSHSNALFPGLAEATASDRNGNVMNIGSVGHPPFVGVESGPLGDDQQSKKNRAILFDQSVLFAEKTDSVRWVILASRGPLYLSGDYSWEHEGSRHDFSISLAGRPDISDNREVWRIAMRQTLSRLLAKGKKVIFVLDNAELGFHPKECFDLRPVGFSKMKLLSPCAVSRKVYDNRNREYRELAASVLKDYPAVKVFDAAAQMCDDQWCWAVKHGDILYRDGDHLSAQGSRVVANELAKMLTPNP